MRLLIDNYDSFTFNLYQMIGIFDPQIRVIKNDELTVNEIALLQPSEIILSPGPGTPKDAGVCLAVVRRFAGHIPILGVCMGHEVIVEALGGRIVNALKLMHGKTSPIEAATDTILFAHCRPCFKAARYHSLVADRQTLPARLKIIARTDSEEIMAVEDASSRLFGVQFHPESVMTDREAGRQIIKNFLKLENKCLNGGVQ